MKQLIDFKNGIARQLQYEDWDEFVRTQQQYGKYPFREHDRAAAMYATYCVNETLQDIRDHIVKEKAYMVVTLRNKQIQRTKKERDNE